MIYFSWKITGILPYMTSEGIIEADIFLACV